MYKNLFLEYRIARLEKMLKNEAKQVGDLYHVCTLEAYLKYIQPNDSLVASGKHFNHIYGSSDYVSFTRDKYFVVGTQSVQKSKVLVQLVVDGDKLSEHYKIGPYNDMAFSPEGELVDNVDTKDREQEEVVKGPIKNISKYIKEIRVDVFDMDNSALTKIRRSKLADNPKATYFHFIVKYQDKAFTAFMRENGIKFNSVPLNDVMSLLKEYVDRDKFNDLLFSWDEDDIRKAIKLKANLNVAYENGYVLENYCDSDKNENIVELLLDNGADPNIRVTNNKTPVMVAAEFDCPALIQLLYDSGADVNAVDSNGDTALIIASRNKNKSSVNALINVGADVSIANVFGDTAASVAGTKQIATMISKLS